MGSHLLDAKKIIIRRGMAASQKPIGRALYAFFIRTDMQFSVISGNPVSLDETGGRTIQFNEFSFFRILRFC